MDEVWNAIIAEALKRGLETSDGAVPGAKLRELVAHIALKHGVAYPPPGHESEKFGAFLKQFESMLIVLRREGQDLLVAPSDMPQLLDSSGNTHTQIRDDIFEAFTRIPRGSPLRRPWYARDTDMIEWFAENEEPDESRFTRIPPATLDQELNDRHTFSLSSEIEKDVQDRLLGTLTAHSALASFSNELRAHGLTRRWHFHRFSEVIRRIRKWCETEHIQWRDEWITPVNQRTKPDAPALTSALAEERRSSFGHLVETLTDEDLRRISVPLDIVLRLFPK
jgi:hypothetical protein